MKKIDILVSSLVYAVYMLISCVIVMCAEILAVKIVNLFVVTEYFSLTVIRALLYTVGVNALLAVISYREGYKTAYFSIPETLISGAIATLLHLVFALLFNFEAFSAGGVRSITALIRFGSDLNSNALTSSLTRLDFIPFFLLNSLVYIGIIIGFGKLGQYKRLADREELLGTDSEEQ
ncbi:MAG: hypothetical protein E7611_01000 [Ruminococcaceae bacterium]|nr:hypothetical protein [Oscillospiraceae bacterium]